MRTCTTLVMAILAAALLVPTVALAQSAVVPPDRADRIGTAPAAVVPPDRADRIGTAATAPVIHPDDRTNRWGTTPVVLHPDDRADRFGTASSPLPVAPAATTVVRISEETFDWTSALIGSLATVGLTAILAGLALSLRRRQSVVSA